MKNQNLLKALEYAVKIIEAYQLDVRNLKDYLKEGYDIEGFCQGTIYKDAINDIKRIMEKDNG